MDTKHVNWLHISDLHVGMKQQGWLWPTVKTSLKEDLERLHAKAGPWHFVIFSGDLVKAGAASEFERFGEVIEEFRQWLLALGSNPIFFLSQGIMT